MLQKGVFLLLLLAVSLPRAACRPRPHRGGRRNAKVAREEDKGGASKRGEYYGQYNPCKYDLWPWPHQVQCSSEDSLWLPSDFSLSFSSESKALDSVVLQDAFRRYQELFFLQPTRLSRGVFVEPQFHFDIDDDDDYDHDFSPESGGDKNNTTHAQTLRSCGTKKSSLVKNVFVTVWNDHDGSPKTLDADESYEIESVPPLSDNEEWAVNIIANSVWGALYGLETFSQMIEASSFECNDSNIMKGYSLRGAPFSIKDSPRYPWRGILLDTSNHFIKVKSIKKLLDAMASTKLNVLHWHIVDSYSFPYMSATFSDIAEAGKWTAGSLEFQNIEDNAQYGFMAINEVVSYAMLRGIRVVVEVDMPGHAYSWGLSSKYKDITTSCPTYTDELGHIDDIPLDPTLPKTYDLVYGLLSELTEQFPDLYVHLGGDEVKYGCWNESSSIKTWMHNNGFEAEDFYSLEQYFFENVGGYTTSQLGRKVVAWEEVFFDDSGGSDGAHGSWIGSTALPAATTVVEVWTGPDFIEEARRHGYDAVLAYGWYLDRQNPVDGEETWFFGDSWSQMYLVDPEPNEDGANANDASELLGKALGGEISMWTEQVDDANMESQMWPRAAAGAERLWSPQSLTDLSAAAPRLSMLRCRLISRFKIRAGPIWSDYCSATAELQ